MRLNLKISSSQRNHSGMKSTNSRSLQMTPSQSNMHEETE